MRIVQTVFTLTLTLFVSMGVAFAQESVPLVTQESTQAVCFKHLKADLAEAGIFTEPLETLNGLTYETVEQQFSRKYKSMSSFGNLEVGEPILSHRLYSFGEQTGYKHPPLSPFPVSTMSETWDEPAKEYILVEEYIVEPGNGTHFMDCGFIQIGAEDLLQVTRENYLYDGPVTSLKKTAPDASYKSWYSDFISLNHFDEPFVSWSRIFVYPEDTQNDYFSKYAVADAFPANEVASYDVLEFYLQPLVTVQDYEENGAVTEQTFVIDENEEPTKITIPEALQPVQREGIDVVFSKSSYYQAIEALFPEFYELLSFRGSLQYDTFKQLITEEQSPEINVLLNSMYNFKQIKSYYIARETGKEDDIVVENPELDTIILQLADADSAIQGIIANETVETTETTEQENTNTSNAMQYLLIAFVVLLFVIFLVVAVLWKRNNKPHGERIVENENSTDMSNKDIIADDDTNVTS